jgi:NAD(P)-dependent dehydrogenase (short-subunit alcohol dehydrogenase family)
MHPPRDHTAGSGKRAASAQGLRRRDMGLLNGKNALITGGTSGIGLATARLFLAEDARVAITGARQEPLAAVTGKLPDAIAILADAGDITRQQEIARVCRDLLGRLDVVFINAGIADMRPIAQWDEASFDRSIAVNVKGPFFLVQALLPILANPASIILNASINAHIGMPNSSVYGATKAALASLARTLSGELIGRGIRVNAISPGPIATPLYDRIGLTGAALDSLVGQIPLGRRGTAEEIAQAALFFASDHGAFAVGSELVIDGGMSTL